MEPVENIQQYEFFAPGEVCLFFQHGALEGTAIDELLRENRSLWRLLEKYRFRCLDVQTFAGDDESIPTYSLVRAQLPTSREPGDNERENLNRSVIEVVDTIYQDRRGRFSNDQMQLIGATPNWYSGVAQLFVDGGPGAQPVDANVKAMNVEADLKKALGRYKAQAESVEAQGASKRAEVDVYVLDTIPSPRSWIKALDKTETATALRGLASKTRIRTATDLGVILPDDHHEIAGHLYEMTDHGLFIAGIIHELAPTTKLHLLEVLNKYGVGTLTSLLAGLHAIPTRLENPTIINCSLMMAVRSHNLCQKYPYWKTMRDEEPDYSSLNSGIRPRQMPRNAYLAYLMHPLEFAIQQRLQVLARNSCVKLVAAAGNDGRSGLPRQPARYPAAFPNVIGVAALDEHNQPAVYSNYADDQPREGIAVFGGDVEPTNHEITDQNYGIAGLYIGDLPQTSAPPSNGTARWAGTSFATGVVSGMMAQYVIDGMSCEDAEAKVRREHPRL